MALLEVDPIKRSDPDTAGKAYREQTAALNKLAANRLIGADKHRSSDALQRLVNAGALDKTRLANIGSLRTKALGEGHTLPQFGSGLNEQIRQKEALRQAVAASGGIKDHAAAGRLNPATVGRTAVDAIQLPLGKSLPPVVAAAKETARTLGKKIQRTVQQPGGGYAVETLTDKEKGPSRQGATPTAQHLPGENLTPQAIKNFDDYVTAAARLPNSPVTGNEKVIRIEQDERGKIYVIMVQGKELRIRPKSKAQ